MSPRDRTPWGGPLKRAIPLLLAAGICAWLGSLVGWDRVTVSVGRARFDWFIPASIAYVIINFWVECLGLWTLFTRAVVRTPLREVLIVRAVTQFMGAVNVWLSQMGMAFYYARRSGLPMSYLTGVYFLLLIVDLTVTFLFAGSFIKPTGTPFDPV